MTRLFIFDFFTTIGLSSKLKTLLQGGKPLVILLITAVSYLFIQNLTGVAIVALIKLDLPIGLLSGSVALSGGHGTAIAFFLSRRAIALIFADKLGMYPEKFSLFILDSF